MKIWKASQILFLTALAAISSLTACASTTTLEEESRSPVSDTIIESPSDSSKDTEDTSEPEPPPQQTEKDIHTEQDMVPELTKSWQEIYISILDTVRAQNTGTHFGIDDTSYTDYDAARYQLYDIDKDSIPELIIEYGVSEVGRRVHIYTIHDNKVIQIGSGTDGGMYTTHGRLQTWPGENGIVFYHGHMGTAGASRWTLTDGKLASETLFEEYIDGDSEYTDLQAIVPGTQPIDSFSIDIDLPVLCYQQIRMDRENRLPVERVTTDNTIVKQTLLDVIENNGMVNGAVSDPFASGVGSMTFQDYLGPGMADEFAKYPLSVSRYAWADVNGDGQTECVLHLIRSEQDSYPSDTYAVMSLQGDEVYIYGWSYFSGVVLENGIFAYGSYEELDTLIYAERLIFDGKECFQYSVEPPSDVGEAAWETLER